MVCLFYHILCLSGTPSLPEKKWKWSCSVMSGSLQPHGPYSPWNSPGQNARVDNLSLLQVGLPMQGSNPGLPHCRRILYHHYQKGGAIDAFGVTFFFFSPLISQASLHRQMQKHFSVWYYIFPLIYGNLTSRIYFKLLASPLFFGYRWKLETECETHQRLSWLHTRITWEILNIGAQDALTEYSDLIPQGGHPNNGH